MARRRSGGLALGSAVVSLRRSALVRAIAAASLALSACEAAPVSVLERVEPSRGLNDRAVEIVLVGHHFAPSLDSKDDALAVLPWEGTVGDRPLEDVRWLDAARIAAVVPLGLRAGSYAVTLRSGGRETRLPDAYTAVEPAAPRIDRLEPARISSAGGIVRLRGIGFHRGSVVRTSRIFDAAVVDVPTTWISEGELAIQLSPLSPGPLRIEVATPVGGAFRDLVVEP